MLNVLQQIIMYFTKINIMMNFSQSNELLISKSNYLHIINVAQIYYIYLLYLLLL